VRLTGLRQWTGLAVALEWAGVLENTEQDWRCIAEGWWCAGQDCAVQLTGLTVHCRGLAAHQTGLAGTIDRQTGWCVAEDW